MRKDIVTHIQEAQSLEQDKLKKEHSKSHNTQTNKIK